MYYTYTDVFLANVSVPAWKIYIKSYYVYSLCMMIAIYILWNSINILCAVFACLASYHQVFAGGSTSHKS